MVWTYSGFWGIVVLCLVLAVTTMSVASGPARGQDEMTLISPDKPAPVIIIGVGASASEHYAAHEMATYLEKITGKTIEIVDDTNCPEDRIIIALGRSRLTQSIDTSGLGCEQLIIDIQRDRMTIVGGRREARPGQSARDAGTLYGVYEFLDGLGVRWYRPEPWGEHVPKSSTINLKVGRTISPVPSYPLFRKMASYGLTCYGEETEDEFEQVAIWQARNRLNVYTSTRNAARDEELDAKLGGQEHYEYNHMYRHILPPIKYFVSHPEYFALIDGKRDQSDLCLSNPHMQRVFAENLIAKAQATPELSCLSIEPSDCRGSTCQCDQCKAMELPQNKASDGAGSNRVAKFSNIVAGLVAQEAPWVKLMWLGYSSHTAAPTNIERLESNTIVMLAPINQWSDWRKRLMDPMSNANAALVKTIQDWAALKPSSLMVWEYFDGYGWPGPLPITHCVADRWRNYRQLGIKGIFNHPLPSWGPQGLDTYMSVKLAWNPDIDVDQELDLYYSNYYGPAAKPMKAYHQRLFEALETAPYPVQSGGRGMHLLFTPTLVNELGEYMAEAEKAYGDLVRWMRRVNSEDWIFGMFRDQELKEDAAETIFPQGGAGIVGGVWLVYLPYDLLMNWMNMHIDEETVLRDF